MLAPPLNPDKPKLFGVGAQYDADNSAVLKSLACRLAI
jgi:hypothetical protein